jgi:hypothetical protein
VDTSEKKEPVGIKTHEEIVALFRELKTMEERIKNPELLELIEPEILFEEVEPPESSEKEGTERPSEIPIEPEEILGEKKEKRRRFPSLKLSRKERLDGKKPGRIWWRKEAISELEPSELTEIERQLEEPVVEVKPVRSTFTLQLDEEGNLIGFILKKPKLPKEKKGWPRFRRRGGEEAEKETEEEPEPGIKGKLKRVVSKLRRKKSSDEESGGGIGSKIKGIFSRRKKE